MKAITIRSDAGLLAEFDRNLEVRRDGRSVAMREMVSGYLKNKRQKRIAKGGERGYGKSGAPEFKGWAREGVWPE